jgi:hypothetical protein
MERGALRHPVPRPLHPTIAAAGTGGTIEGGRGDEVVGRRPAQPIREPEPDGAQEGRGLGARVAPLASKGEVGRAVVIGTSHHPDDYLSHIRAAGDWVVCHMNLLGDGPDVYATITYPDDVDWNRLGEPVAGAQWRERDIMPASA